MTLGSSQLRRRGAIGTDAKDTLRTTEGVKPDDRAAA
jgi:hypothetical protein